MRRRKGLSFYQKKKAVNASLIKEICSWLFGCVAAVALAFVLVYYFGMSTSVIGMSMEPDLTSGQKVLVNRFVYTFVSPKIGDVVVFLPNGDSNAHFYVKRVVATSGDKVQIRQGTLYVNDKESPYQFDKIEEPGIAENEIVLDTDEYFVMGDNCNNSEDSRSANIGLVKKNYLIGKAWFHLGSENSRIGFVKDDIEKINNSK